MGGGGILEVLLHLLEQTQGFGWGQCVGSWKLVTAQPCVPVPRHSQCQDNEVARTPGMGQGADVPGSAEGWVIPQTQPLLGCTRFIFSSPSLSRGVKHEVPHFLCFAGGEQLCFDIIHLKC